MHELFLYLLKSSGLILIFFGAYYFLLRKETLFNNNRWFLLSGLITSALLPLFFIKKIVIVEKPKLSLNDLMLLANQKSTSSVTEQAVNVNWAEIILVTYGLVAFALTTRLIINSISLFKLLHKQHIEQNNQFSLVNLQQNIAPFSFFNFIVFNSSLYSEQELENILLHEKVHSKEKHSIDLLIAKFFTILFWFNPIVWLYKNAIIQNLEYIADNKAIQLIDDKKSYQMALLKVVSHQNCLSITSPFSITNGFLPSF